MSIGAVLLITLIIVLVASLPAWPYSVSWGFGPAGVTGLIALVLLILLISGRV